uniref:Uncharacterized protein n=1 Tax=viral metagenome TaxID=1070528 RepID=A0A6M3LV52_9ZZZZ
MGIETPEEETTRIRDEIAQEMQAEEEGTAPLVDAHKPELAKEAVVDPWEGVNPALKGMFDTMSQTVQTLQGADLRLKQAESRIGAITNELHAAKQAAEKVKVAPTAEQMAVATKSDENWENLKKDFPEWAEAFDGRFDNKLSVKLEELKKEIGGGTTTEELEKLKTTLAEGTQTEIQKGILTFFKPKWKDTIGTNDWKAWIAAQSAETVALTTSDQAVDAVSLIDQFEEATQKQKTATEIAADRKRRMKTSVLPEGGKAVPVKSEADMSDAELRAKLGKEVFAES